MYRYLLLFCFIFFYNGLLYAQLNISGTVKNIHGPVAGATLVLNNRMAVSATNKNGYFIFNNLPAGNYTLLVSSVGYRPDTIQLQLKDADYTLAILLYERNKQLDTVTVNAVQEKTAFTRLKDVEGTAIYAGKKTEVILLKDLIGNKATNNTRQVYAKVAGLNIWENDVSGLQLAIGGRGLSPNRVANFNTRQNGYDISADALGYPESYYTPPVEAVERIEIVRGAASLQYGTQFGGMINFRMLHGSDTDKFSLTTRLTGGSFKFFNTSTSIGGTTGKLNYVGFYQHKSGNGWRPNSDFNANTGYAAVTYNAGSKISVTLQYTHMDYLQHQPGGLTDADFGTDPHQSTRARNWFKVNWNLGALIFDYQVSNRLRLNSRLFGLAAERNALGILTYINRVDDGSADRNLYIDHYRNWGNETRLLYQYNTGKLVSTALMGVRYYQGRTHRQQGFGNNGSSGKTDDFTFHPAFANDTLKYSDYTFPEHNLALFAENIFRVNDHLNIIPGVRYEQITTKAEGNYTNALFDGAGNLILQQKVTDNKLNARSFLIAGIGATYNIRSNIQLYVNFSQNYKAINFNDLRTLNPNLRVDSNLHDEKGFSADLGIRKSNGIFNYDINFFLVNYDNKIGSILSADSSNSITYNLRTNVAQSVHVGLESYIEADIWKLIKGTSSKTTLAIFSNFSLISAKYTRSKDPSIDGRRVEFVPNIIFKTGLSFRRKKLSASYQFSYTGSQFTDATNATFTTNAIDGGIPSYIIMDLSADYTFNKRWSVSSSINNLANHAYFTRRADSYPGPGIVPADARSLYVTLQFHL
jgi:Fe(3+) dicitrate transport protein